MSNLTKLTFIELDAIPDSMKDSSFLNSLSKSMAASKLKEWDNAFLLPSKWHRFCPREDTPSSKPSELRMSRDKARALTLR